MSIKHYLLATFLLLTVAAKAQRAAFDYPEYSNDIVKLNVLSLPMRNLSVQYEKVLSQRISVAMGIRYAPKTALPFKSFLINAYSEGDQDTKDIINKSRLGNLAVTPELRFYLGKKGYGQGFYLAPYFRYVRFTSNTVVVNYNEPGGVKRSVILSGNYQARAGGLMAGAQWFLNHRLTLDWWISGLHYGSGSGSFTGVPATPFTAGEQADIKKGIDDLNVPMVNKTVAVSANKIQVDATSSFGGFRGGLCLGFHF